MSRIRPIARLWITTVLASAGAAYPLCALGFQNVTAEKDAADPQADTVAEDEILFEADSVSRQEEDGPIVAEGDVRAFFGDRYLRADRLTYNPTTQVVTAEGNVSVTDGNLETVFAGRAILSGDLRDGIVENFSALLEENTRLAASSAIEEQGARTRLTKAVYTSCDVCKDNGEGKTPTWRVKALRVTRDKERKVVRFHHAFFEIKGVPILYTPYLQGPDPSVERQSGFLTPRIGASSRLGFNFELPYYLAISNSQDATLSPKYTAEDGVLWQGEYRLRGKNGYHVLAGGFINVDNEGKDSNNDGVPDNEQGIPGARWHYFGRGYREIGDKLRISYDIERVSDNDYLRQYRVERRGDLRQAIDRGNTNQLRSNVRASWTNGGSRLLVDTYLFQGLRATDNQSLTPYILPLIDFNHNFKSPVLGGKASLGANFASLYRTQGVDSQRLTATANWDRTLVTNSGHRFHLFGEARADAYYFQDLDQGTEFVPGIISSDPSRFEARFAPTAGVEWSYPLARSLGSARLFLEPRVQLVASPANIENSNIINEDSQSIEFDYAGLFDFNKATGFDAFEDGQRMNIGVAASAIWPNGLAIEASVGQQYRLQSTNAFDFASGLGEVSSDIVGNLNVRYGSTLGVENRFRISEETGTLERAESIGYVNVGPMRGNVSYIRLTDETAQRREELLASARINLTDHWYSGAAWRINLANQVSSTTDPRGFTFEKETIRQDFTLGYEDECSTFAVTYRRDRTQTNTLSPDNAFLVTFTLKSLVQ